jgi:hypothetical protein
MPSAPKASFTPSKTPMLSTDDDDRDGAGAWTKACAHDVVAAAMRIDDHMIIIYVYVLSVWIICKVRDLKLATQTSKRDECVSWESIR